MDRATGVEGHRTRHLRGELTGSSRDIVKVWGPMKILERRVLRCVEINVEAVYCRNAVAMNLQFSFENIL